MSSTQDKNKAKVNLKNFAQKLAEKSKRSTYKVITSPIRKEEKDGKMVDVALKVHKKNSIVILTDVQKKFFEKHGANYEIIKEEPKKATVITKK